MDHLEFRSALEEATGQVYDQGTSDAVFKLFDADGNGTVNNSEFMVALMDFGGTAAAPPPSRRHGGAVGPSSSVQGGAGGGGGGGSIPREIPREQPRTPRHVEAIAESQEYELADSESMTDSDVMNELSQRLNAEGVPVHRLFKVRAFVS